jgi:hypothetical protein
MSITSIAGRLRALYYGAGSSGLFVRWFLIFTCIFLAVASWALFRLVATEHNPFFYAEF